MIRLLNYSVVVYTLVCTFHAFAQAQDEKIVITRIGLGGQVLSGFHNAQFRSLVLNDKNVITCCPENYNVLPHIGFAVNALAEFPLFRNGGIAARLGLSSLSTDFSQQESILIGTGTGAGTLNGTIIYSLQTSLTWLDIEPYFTFRPLEFFSLYAGIGGAITLASSFRQYEEPSAVQPMNGQPLIFSRRNVVEGGIVGATAILPKASIGASYEIPIGLQGNILVAPEIFAQMPFGNVVAPEFLRAKSGGNADAKGFWSFWAVRGGISVRFSPERTTPRTVEEQLLKQPEMIVKASLTEKKLPSDTLPNTISQKLKDTIAPRIVKKAAKMEIAGITGIRTKDSTAENPIVENFLTSSVVKVEETLASRSRYVLNNIFFAPHSTELDKKYQRLEADKRSSFYLEDLVNLDVLQIYYQVLNIIGQRMNTHPKAILTLTGFADGLSEKNDKVLAKLRADVIRAYFLSVWDIAPERILTKTGTSRIPTNTNGDELLESEEQRRVEIQCNVPDVLEELRFEYRIRTVDPPKLRITIGVDRDDTTRNTNIATWKLSATQFVQESDWENNTQILLSENGTNTDFVPEKAIEWDISTTPQQPRSREPIRLTLSGKQSDGTPADTAFTAIPVELLSVENKMQQKLRDERIDSYTLFSFAYGTNAPLSGNAEAVRIIQQIKQTLKPGAKVIVRGYSDARGNPSVNQTLSTQRAQSVANLIGFKGADVQGVGVTNLNDNRLPEGRFYNRFVQVDVRTPLQ